MLEGTGNASLVTPATQSGSPAKSLSKTRNSIASGQEDESAASSSSFTSSLTASTALRTPEELRANVLNDPNQPPPKLLSGDLLRASIEEERQPENLEEQEQDTQANNKDGQEDNAAETETKDPRQLTEADLARIRQLTLTDSQVRLNEEAHVRVGGQYASSPAYNYETGPDNRQYAVDGEVSFNSTPIAGNPEATIRKLAIVKRAALAPAEPSTKDRAVATKATQGITQAQAQLRTDQLRAEAELKKEETQAELEKNSADRKAENDALINPDRTENQGPAKMTNTEVQFAGPTPDRDGSVTPQRTAAAFAATSRLQNSSSENAEISTPTVAINIDVEIA